MTKKREATFLTVAAGLSLAFIGAIVSQAASDIEKPTAKLWEELDIVPMPKHIQFTEKDLALDANVVLALGKTPLEQSKIGADWINARMAERGGKALAVVDIEKIPTGKKAIVIGTRTDNPSIEAAARDGVLDVGEKNPGERGYEIRISGNGERIYLAGADPIGALYACVTFGELLNGSGKDVAWREARVRDWPDQIAIFSLCDTLSSTDIMFPVLPKNLTEASKKAYLDDVDRFHDYLLRRKFTGVQYRKRTLEGEKFVYAPWMDLLREGIERGKKRGIDALIYAEKPYPGLIKNYPELAKKTDELTSGVENFKRGKWLMSWSMDTARQETARNLAEYIKATGFNHVGFHDTDGGWLENPACWNFRSESDRKRWGNDYAAATIHIFKTYYDELKKLNPDLRVDLVFYPYNIYIFDDKTFSNIMAQTTGTSANSDAIIKEYQKKYAECWRRLSAAFPYRDVAFCVRETTWESVVNWRKLITAERPIFWWLAIGNKYWEPIFSQAPAWTMNFIDRRDNILVIAYADTEGMPLNLFAIREYSWNRETPGARYLKAGDRKLTDMWRWAEPDGDVYRVILPKIVRNIFGRQAAPYIQRAVSQNIDIRQALGRSRSSTYDLLKTPERRQWQADNAEQAATALNELWDKCRETNTRMGMDDYAFSAFVVMREALNGCKWFSKAKARLMFAEALAAEYKLDEAKKCIAQAAKYAEAGKTMTRQMLEERPEIITRTLKKLSPQARRVMAENVDFVALATEIATTSANLERIAENNSKNKLIMSNLAKGRKVGGYLVNGIADIVVDGDPNEKIWASAPTIDCFTLIGQKKLADELTSVRVIRDAENLYISWVCYAAPGKTIQDRDTLDIFLNIPELNQEKSLELFISAGGTFSSSIPAEKTITRALKRESALWRGETRVRVAALAGDTKLRAPWAINICRNCYYDDGSPTQISAILPFTAIAKRDVANFPKIQFSPNAAPAPTVALDVKDFKIQTVTLPDRIASVASFHVTVDANAVLSQVKLFAETYGPDGKSRRLRELAEFPHIYLHEEPKTLYEAEFTEVVEKGGVLLILKSREGEFKRWVRFGGWEGANGVGAIFAPIGPDNRMALAAPCFFPSSVALDTDRAGLLNAREGTLELWVTPTGPERSATAEALVFFGAPKKNANPIAIMGYPLSVTLYKNAMLVFIAGERGVGSWNVSAALSKPLKTGEWTHLACVWDATATPENQARLYLDGKRLAATVKAKTVAGLADTAIRVGVSPPHTIQLGALKSGAYEAKLAIKDFRISRNARYDKDFTPTPPALDKGATALLPFNGSLEGRGMIENGATYAVLATAGIDRVDK